MTGQTFDPLSVELCPNDGKEALEHDVRLVQDLLGWVDSKLAGSAPGSRILAVISAGPSSDVYLGESLPRLLRQADETAHFIDLVIGLNNGASPPGDLETVLPGKVSLTPLWAAPKTGIRQVAEVFGNESRQGPPFRIANPVADDGHRLFLIQQPSSEYSAGKIRMFQDIYGMLIASIGDGWKAPLYTLMFDAETQLFDDTDGEFSDSGRALQNLVDVLESDPAVGIAGARMRNCVYQKNSNGLAEPDFSAKIAATHRLSNRIHGKSKTNARILNWLGGPAYLGRTPLLLAVHYIVAVNCPGCRMEDFATYIVSRKAGFPHKIVSETVATNACPPIEEHEAGLQQMARWLAGNIDLLEYYDYRSEVPLRDALRGLAEFVLHPSVFLEVRSLARLIEANRGSIRDGEAVWNSLEAGARSKNV